MPRTRSLSLAREALGELAPDQLAAVAAAGVTEFCATTGTPVVLGVVDALTRTTG